MKMEKICDEISGISERSNTIIRSRSWFLTWNNPDLENFQFSQLLEVHGGMKWVFQKEQGESGTIHYQGVVNFKVQKTLVSLKKIDERIHWEICKSWENACIYCSKIEGRLAGPFTKGWSVPEYIERLSYEQLWPHQKKIWDIMMNPFPTNRTIYWFWEPDGNVGKTELVRKAILEIPDSMILGSKASDMKYAVSEYMLEHKRSPKLCILHFVRSQEEYVSYTGIEEISDGVFFSNKYKSRQGIMNKPKIICFANFEPDLSAMSMDRWIIKRVFK